VRFGANKVLVYGVVTLPLILVLDGLIGSALDGDRVSYIRSSALVVVLAYFGWTLVSLQEQFHPTLVRLERYAMLINCRDPELPLSVPFSSSLNRWLSPEACAILLGALKKIETKAASLLVVWGIMIGGGFAMIASQSANTVDLDKLRGGIVAMSWMIMASLPLLFCFRQIDTRDLPSSAFQSAKEMEEMLIWDLIVKESLFRFSFRMTFVTVILLGVWVIYERGDITMFDWLRQ